MSVSIEEPTSQRQTFSSARRSWRSTLVAVALISLASGFVIGYWRSPPRQDGLKVFGQTDTFGEARKLFPLELAYFLGQQRTTDGTLYGEWVRARFARQCRGLDPKKVEFTALMQGPFSNGAIRWDVEATYGGSLPASCNVHKLLVTIGGMWSTTGEILPLPPAADIGSTRFGAVDKNGKTELQAGRIAAGDSWWTQFRVGAGP